MNEEPSPVHVYGDHQDEISVQMADIDIYWFFIVIFESLLFFI